MKPIFFNTKLHRVKAMAIMRALRKSKLLMACVLKNLLKSKVSNGINTTNPIAKAMGVSNDRVVLMYFLPSVKSLFDIASVK